MKQQSIFFREVQLNIRAPNSFMANSLSPFLLKGVFIMAGFCLPAVSATTLTEAAALLNVQSSGEMKSLVSDAARLLRDYDGKGNRLGSGVDENIIPFLSNLVENITLRNSADEKVAPKKVMPEKVAVKIEPVVVHRIAKVAKLPVVKQWAGLHRTMPTLKYSWANTRVKNAVAKPPAVLQILPKVPAGKKAYVQYSTKQ